MRRVLLVAVLAALLVAPVARAWTWPVGGPVLQPFSFDPAHPYAAGEHRGIDIGAAAGEVGSRARIRDRDVQRHRPELGPRADDHDRGRARRHAHPPRLDRRSRRAPSVAEGQTASAPSVRAATPRSPGPTSTSAIRVASEPQGYRRPAASSARAGRTGGAGAAPGWRPRSRRARCLACRPPSACRAPAHRGRPWRAQPDAGAPAAAPAPVPAALPAAGPGTDPAEPVDEAPTGPSRPPRRPGGLGAPRWRRPHRVGGRTLRSRCHSRPLRRSTPCTSRPRPGRRIASGARNGCRATVRPRRPAAVERTGGSVRCARMRRPRGTDRSFHPAARRSRPAPTAPGHSGPAQADGRCSGDWSSRRPCSSRPAVGACALARAQAYHGPSCAST